MVIAIALLLPHIRAICFLLDNYDVLDGVILIKWEGELRPIRGPLVEQPLPMIFIRVGLYL